MIDLKPCPFCGGPARMWDTDVWVVVCNACEIEGEFSRESETAAAVNWNSRPPEDAAAAEIKRLRELLGEFVADGGTFIDNEYGCCKICDAGWSYDLRAYIHTPECLVTRARQALEQDTPDAR